MSAVEQYGPDTLTVSVTRSTALVAHTPDPRQLDRFFHDFRCCFCDLTMDFTHRGAPVRTRG